MAEISRTLRFNVKELNKDITLLLTFALPGSAQESKGIFPTAWKVIKFKKGMRTAASVEYTGNTAFAVPQIDARNLVTPSFSALCGTGQKCSILEDGVITPAVPGDKGYLTCTNISMDTTDIAVGVCDDSSGNFEAIFVWEKVDLKSEVKVQFPPILEIYATTEYQNEEIIRGELTSPLLWKKHLKTLPKQTVMNVSIDEASGAINITEA